MENIVENYLETLQFINEDGSLIEEAFVDIIKKLDPRKLKSLLPSMKAAYKKGDMNKLYKINKSISPTEIPVNKIEKLAKKSVPNFGNCFSLAFKVLSNTFPKANINLLKALSITISANSSKSNNPIGETKKTLKRVAFKINKLVEDIEKKNEEKEVKIPKSILVDEVIGWTCVGLVLSGIGVMATINLGATLSLLGIGFVLAYIIKLQRKLRDKSSAGVTDFISSGV